MREAIIFVNNGIVAGNTITFASDADAAFENGGVIRLSQIQDNGLVLTADATIDGATAGGSVIITGDVNGDDATVDGTIFTNAIANTNTDGQSPRLPDRQWHGSLERPDDHWRFCHR